MVVRSRENAEGEKENGASERERQRERLILGRGARKMRTTVAANDSADPRVP